MKMTAHSNEEKNWLAFEHRGVVLVCTREQREKFILYCQFSGITNFGIVLKKFKTQLEALQYCKKINEVNYLLNNILLK